MSRMAPGDAAIVGMACRFPGAGDLFAYWENILAGRDCIGDVPPGRWDPATFHDLGSPDNDRVPTRRGGYLGHPIRFDPAAHGVMPMAVDGGEPEQFLILDAARAALADAGPGGGVVDGRRVEVVIGRGNYFNRGNLNRLQHGRIVAQTVAILRDLHPDWSDADLDAVRRDLKSSLPPFGPETVPGQLTNATAGRVADRLGFTGAAFVVDAASASSLVALDLGARALAERRADVALVGAVYIEADVDFPMVFKQVGALSPTGVARPFAADADGMLSGEGAGVVVLKRLADAERDGDRIYAVVKGVGLASDGRGPGLAAPDARGHLRAIRRAHRRAGVRAASVGLIEGHGLGVPAADLAELRAIRAAFPPGRRALGAVSSMIGHAMPAAGMAGLIKAALALHHRVLPPTLHAGRVHALLDRADSPAQLNRSARPWIHADPATPRLAAVNAFGFAGINAHAVLQEHARSADAPGSPGAMPRWDAEVFLFAAPDRVHLLDRCRAVRDWLRAGPEVTPKDLAATLNGGAGAGGAERLGIVARSLADLSDRLDTAIARLDDPSCSSIRDGRGTYFRDASGPAAGGLALMFPGEGSQYPGMLADLCPHFPEVRALFDTADRLARESGQAALPSDLIFGGEADPALWSAGSAVNLVLSSQWALYQVLTRLGIGPDAVVGHSSGELLALAAAGVIAVDRSLEGSLGRLGAIFGGLDQAGDLPAARLLAAATDRVRALEACRAAGESVRIAVDNCPHQVVLAGPPADVEAVAAELRSSGVACEDLPFARAYHTPEFAPAMGPLAAFFAGLAPKPPAVPIYSCASAGRMPDDPEAVRALAVSQWTRPVAFRDTVEAMHRDGIGVFVDVGARGNLAGFVEDTLRGRPILSVAANLPRRSGTAQLNHLVAALFARGIPVRADFLYARRRPVPVDVCGPIRPARVAPALAVGFPEMRLSEDLVARLKARTNPDLTIPGFVEESGIPAPEIEGFALENDASADPGSDEMVEAWSLTPSHANGHAADGFGTPEGLETGRIAPPRDGADADEAEVLSHLATMDAFLDVQRDVMAAYLAGVGVADSRLPDAGESPSEDPWESEQAASRRADQGASGLPEDDVRDEPDVFQPSDAAEAGPWAGSILRFQPGLEVVTTYTLSIERDPVAEHHTLGGRRVSALDPGLKGLPVLPFAVMAEMLAQVGAILVEPGRALVSLREVKARKWVRYEDEPVEIRISARRDPSRPDEARVEIRNLGLASGRGEADQRDLPPVFEGVAVFAPARPTPVAPAPFDLGETTDCRFTARSIYDEQWLFHGPALRAVTRIGAISMAGIEGDLTVLPRAGLFRDGTPCRLLTDPIVLDAFTHLLGCWGLDRLADDGDVIFPLGMAELTLHGDDPPEGSVTPCRVAIRTLQRHRVVVDAEVLRPDGRVWMRITGWEDWRFRWPGVYRDVLRMPDRVFVGEPLALPGEHDSQIQAVWLEPPADMGRPVWRDVLEQTQLGPAERAACLASPGPESRRTQRLWGRIAAKEAARRLWRAEGRPDVYPADLAIVPDPAGRPWLRHAGAPGPESMPAVSIAHADGVALALAMSDPAGRPGIDVEPVVDRDPGFEAAAFAPGERAWLDRRAGDDTGSRAEWVTRAWCAKEAAAKSSGLGLDGGPGAVAIVDAGGDGAFGIVPRGRTGPPIRVATARRGGYVWAWTAGREAEG